MNISPCLLTLLLAAVVMSLPVAAQDDAKPKRQSSPEGAKTYIVAPQNGSTVKKKFKVNFGLTGMGISPAGITVQGQPIPDTGHHHLLVDVVKLPPLDVPLPADQHDKIMHFGKGQTETMLELAPGTHTLQLIFADYAHVPHDPPVMSEKITVIVE
jgi:hypothetical protein